MTGWPLPSYRRPVPPLGWEAVMLNRRVFLYGTMSAALALPLAARAQPTGKMYRVALVATTSPVATLAGPNPTNPAARAFVHELRDRGWVKGENFILKPRSLEGRPERAGEVVAELLALNVDVIVTTGNPMTQAARQLTTTVPIVMGTSRSPVEAGLVASRARPGGNITGLTIDAPELYGKRLELLRDVLPTLRRVAYIGTTADWEDEHGGIAARSGARALGLAVFLAEHRHNDYAAAFAVITRERPDAALVAATGHNFAHRALIADWALRTGLPAMYHTKEMTEAGGLMSYGVEVRDLYRRAAIYVDRILKGARPGDMPIEQPSKFELVINLKTAKALGLTVPPSLLLRADQVIE